VTSDGKICTFAGDHRLANGNREYLSYIVPQQTVTPADFASRHGSEQPVSELGVPAFGTSGPGFLEKISFLFHGVEVRLVSESAKISRVELLEFARGALTYLQRL
jgi:hypothetical protein